MEELTTSCNDDTDFFDEGKYFVSPPPLQKDQKRVLVFGTFDIIHPSHLRFLLEARRTANCPACQLVVVLARDSSIERIKGHKPIFHEQQRLRLLSGLRVVDFALLGHEGIKHFDIILDINPDFIVLGYDQIQNEQPLLHFLKEHRLAIQLCRLPKFESGDLISSSDVRNKVLEMVADKK